MTPFKDFNTMNMSTLKNRKKKLPKPLILFSGMVLGVLLTLMVAPGHSQTGGFCAQNDIIGTQEKLNRLSNKARRIANRSQRVLASLKGKQNAGRKRYLKAADMSEENIALAFSLPPIVQTSCDASALCTQEDLTPLTRAMASNALHICDQAVINLNKARREADAPYAFIRRLKRRAIRLYRLTMNSLDVVPRSHSTCVS